MKKLNIQYRTGPKTNAELKIVPEGYKFKFTANNGKMEEQIKQELHERKQHRSERKIQLREKINAHQNINQLYRKKTEKYSEANTSKERKMAVKDSQSVHNINKVFTPNVPVNKRINNVPPLSRQTRPPIS